MTPSCMQYRATHMFCFFGDVVATLQSVCNVPCLSCANLLSLLRINNLYCSWRGLFSQGDKSDRLHLFRAILMYSVWLQASLVMGIG
ncbi:hypothetical protein CPSG_02026 [Coccidioides posadasii str. Silveira]|uniref:Uncharacterized protein n=1 Tax=Coccidioides posadasii (strain RMSCC 757 / Silveira) TaxID=443226 RepID=E9CX43_COCPS|nr:hypothetical protein CPSG_02026 [Coccidioides posadasii str. Silveira]